MRRVTYKAKPAKPEHRGAQSDKRDVVRRVVDFLALNLGTRAEDVDGSEGGEAGGGVHDDATRKVPDAPRAHPAAAPDPMAEWRVDDDDPNRDEDEVGGEAEAVGEGAGHERGGDASWTYEGRGRRRRGRGEGLQGEVLSEGS